MAERIALKPAASRQLLRDIEKYPQLTKAAQIIALRPSHYGGAYRKASHSRHSYLIKLKEKNPKGYLSSISKTGLQDELGDIEAQPGILEETADTVLSPTPSKRSVFNSLKSPRATPLKSPPLNSPYPPSPFSPFSPINAMAHLQDKDYPGQRKPPGTTVMWETIEQAIDDVDDVIDLSDFHSDELDLKPEDNPYGIFIQKVSKIEFSDGSELYTKLKMGVPSIIDLRDFKKWNLFIVCRGRALLIVKPRLPTFFLHDFETVLRLEGTPCARTNQETKVTMNKLKKDDNRLYHHILINLPEDVALNQDFSKGFPHIDTKIPTQLRILPMNVLMGKKGKERKEAHRFFHCYWECRVLAGNSFADMLDVDDESDDELAQATAGMAQLEVDDDGFVKPDKVNS